MCWGFDGADQISGLSATSSSVARAIAPGLPASTTVMSVAAGGAHTCVLLSNSSVWCWGDDSSSELGDGQTSTTLAPVQVMGIVGTPVALALGDHYSCVQIAGSAPTGDTVECWGDNSNGELGLGSAGAPVAVPTQVVGVSGGTLTGVTQLAAGRTGSATYVRRRT